MNLMRHGFGDCKLLNRIFIMYSIYVRIDVISKQPKIWAINDNSSRCDVITGMLFRKSVDHYMYKSGAGKSRVSKYLSAGYIELVHKATKQDIIDINTTVRGLNERMGENPYLIYCEIMSIIGKFPDPALYECRQSSDDSNQVSHNKNKIIFTQLLPETSEFNVAWIW